MKEFIFFEQWYYVLIIAVLSYLLGGVSAARIISRQKKGDITKIGSGNPGSMNMARTYGVGVGAMTLFFDGLKCAIPVLIVHFIYRDYTLSGTEICASDFVRGVVILGAVLGHIYPLFNHFQGGKGIATTFGGFFAGLCCESIWFLLIVLLCFALIVAYIFYAQWGGMGSLMGISLCCAVQSTIFFIHYGANLSLWLLIIHGLVACVFVVDWFAHRANVRRMFSGEEHRTALRKKKKA